MPVLIQTLTLTALTLLPYAQINAWGFVASAAGIHSLRTLKSLGAQIPLKTCFKLLIMIAIIAPLANTLIHSLLAQNSTTLHPERWSPWLRSRPLSQAWVEEIMLRGVLLTWLLTRFKSKRLSWLIPLGHAAFFSLLHAALYGMQGDWIGVTPLITLFFFGIICNELFLKSGHIGWGYALHVSWNLTRFGGDYLDAGNTLLRSLKDRGRWSRSVADSPYTRFSKA
jgi:hypothetical protein